MIKTKEINMFPDGRLDSKNAAIYLGFSEKTLAMMRCQGTGPEYIKRGRIFYFKTDLDQWLMQTGKQISTGRQQWKE